MGKPQWYYQQKHAIKKDPTDLICEDFSNGFCAEGDLCDRKHVPMESQLSKETISSYSKWNPTAKNEDFFTTTAFICGQLPNKQEQLSKLWKFAHHKQRHRNTPTVPTVKADNWDLVRRGNFADAIINAVGTYQEIGPSLQVLLGYFGNFDLCLEIKKSTYLSFYSLDDIAIAIFRNDVKYVTKFLSNASWVPSNLLDLVHYCGNKEMFKEVYKKIPEHSIKYRTFTPEDLVHFTKMETVEKSEKTLVDITSDALAKYLSRAPPAIVAKNLNKLTHDTIVSILKRIPLTNYSFYANLFYSRELNLVSIRKMYKTIRIQEKFQEICRAGHLTFAPRMKAVSIYGNDISRWEFTPLTEFEKRYMIIPVKRPESGLSIVSKETFLYQFDVFTEGIFRDFSHWKNCVVAGGAVLAALMPTPPNLTREQLHAYYKKNYPHSDIDMYFYGIPTTVDLNKKLESVFRHVKNKSFEQMFAIKTPNTVSMISKRRTVQIVTGMWSNVEDILTNCDIDCSAVAFDGEKVLATPRARLSISKRMIIANPELCAIRGSPGYDLRLLKYATRGFGVASLVPHHFEPKKLNLKNIKIESFLQKNYGLKLLALVAANPQLKYVLLEQKEPLVKTELPLWKLYDDVIRNGRIAIKPEMDGYGNIVSESFLVREMYGKLPNITFDDMESIRYRFVCPPDWNSTQDNVSNSQ